MRNAILWAVIAMFVPAVAFAQISGPPGGVTDNCDRASITQAHCNNVVASYITHSNAHQNAILDGTFIANVATFYDDPDTDALLSFPLVQSPVCDFAAQNVIGFDAFEAVSQGFGPFDFLDLTFAVRHIHVVNGDVVVEQHEARYNFVLPDASTGIVHVSSTLIAERMGQSWRFEVNPAHSVIIFD